MVSYPHGIRHPEIACIYILTEDHCQVLLPDWVTAGHRDCSKEISIPVYQELHPELLARMGGVG
jgi:hypothetical protein